MNSKLKFLLPYIFIYFFQVSFSQDIEPRRWNPLPLKTNVVAVGYAYTTGDIFFDPLLQAEDVTAKVNTLIASYIRPFRIGKKLARFDIVIPYTNANWEGLLNGEPAKVHRSGFTDPRLRFSLNLLGAPASTAQELQEYLATHPTHTNVGVSLAVTLPLGQYYEEKLINLGQNQLIYCPQIGLVHNWKKWSYELTGSVIFYSKNTNFNNGKDKVQDPVYALQTHLIRNFKSRYWASVSLSYGLGGRSVVNRISNNDERGDIQSALAFGFPIMKTQSMKVAYLHSETIKDLGANTNSFALGWTVLF